MGEKSVPSMGIQYCQDLRWKFCCLSCTCSSIAFLSHCIHFCKMNWRETICWRNQLTQGYLWINKRDIKKHSKCSDNFNRELDMEIRLLWGKKKKKKNPKNKTTTNLVPFMGRFIGSGTCHLELRKV